MAEPSTATFDDLTALVTSIELDLSPPGLQSQEGISFSTAGA